MTTTIAEAIKICEEAGYEVSRPKPFPQEGDNYWFFDLDGDANDFFEFNDSIFDGKMIAFGNYFRTEKEAIAARDKVKKLLLSLKK